MTAIASSRVAVGLGAVNEAVGYARSVRPSMPVPDLADDRLWWQVNMHLHGVALDALHAAMAFNDDLAWSAVRHYRDEHRGRAYSSVTVELAHASLTLYSEDIALDDGTVASPSTAAV